MLPPKKLSAFLVTTLLATGPALAQSTAQSTSWTGGYVRSDMGAANVKYNVPGLNLQNTAPFAGAAVGYDIDLKDWVVGASADIDMTDTSLTSRSATELDRIWRLKLRGGYKVGKGLIYGTGGYANAHINNVGEDGGYYIGGGYEHQFITNFSIGGEILYHEFNNFSNTNTDIEVISYQVRGTFRF